MGKQIVFVGIGDMAMGEIAGCMLSNKEQRDWAYHIIMEADGETNKQKSRHAKTDLMNRTSFDEFLYLDADTRIMQDVSVGFDFLHDGWDMVITPSAHQDDDIMWHVSDEERDGTMVELGYRPLQLQAGMFFVTRNERTVQFFDAWHEEWQRHGDEDQAAFLRALNRVPLKIWLLGRPWNGGAIIQHRFGVLRGEG